MGRPRIYDDALRRRLIETAGKLMATEGYHGVSLRVLTKEAGTSTNAVYTLFGSKEALMAEVVLNELDGLLEIVEAIPETEDATTDLLDVVTTYRNFALEKPAVFAGVFEVLTEARNADSVAGRINPDVYELDRRMFKPIDEACERVALQKEMETDARDIAVAMWAFMHGYVVLENTNVLSHIADPDDNFFEKAVHATHSGWAKTKA